MKKKRPFTLLEIMVVIFLIGLISSVIGYSMKGSMDKGRAFKTEQVISRVIDVLEYEIARTGKPAEVITKQYQKYLSEAGLLKNPNAFLKDGWGQEIDVDCNDEGDLVVTSAKYEEYQKSQSK